MLKDDMSGVVDDATYGSDAEASSGDVVYVAPTLMWSGAIEAGKAVTITYSVKAGAAGIGDDSLVNIISRADDPATTVQACATSPDDNSAACSVTNPLVALPLAPGDPGGLAKTGLEAVAPMVLGLLALLAGLVVVLMVRRRRGSV